MALCPQCKREKTDENTTRYSTGDFFAYCKLCTRKYDAEYYAKNSTRHCRSCGRGYPDVNFYSKAERPPGTPALLCIGCDQERRRAESAFTPEELKRRKVEETNLRRALERKDIRSHAKNILKDSRHSDKRHGRENNLDEEFIQTLIAFPCSYCGIDDERISLDRIDNRLGHLRSNVLPCCLRCNWLRRDMPFDVWTWFVATVRQVSTMRQYREWHPGPYKAGCKIK